MCHYALAKQDIAAFCACKLHSDIPQFIFNAELLNEVFALQREVFWWHMECVLASADQDILSFTHKRLSTSDYFILFVFLPRRDQSNWVLWLFLGSVNATEAWLYDQSDRRCAKTENPPHFIVRQLEFNLSYHYLEWSRKKRGTILRHVLKQVLRPSASCLPYCSSSPQTAHCTFSPARK